MTSEQVEQLVATWIAGPDDDLENLSVLLMCAFGRSREGSVAGESETNDLCDSFYLVEDAIWQMEPTPLNLQRIIGWCRGWSSHAGHEALLTTFWDMLNPEQQARYWIKANQQWIPEAIEGWLGEDVIAERSAYFRSLSDKS